MTSLATTNIPTCKWAQRKECVYVTVDIPDAKDETITVANDKLTFKAVSGGKNYECEMILHAAINGEGSKYTVKARNVVFYLEKTDAEADFWPRLLKDKALNKRFVKVDFDKWVDEDEEDPPPRRTRGAAAVGDRTPQESRRRSRREGRKVRLTLATGPPHAALARGDV